jgi:hypothetical protein
MRWVAALTVIAGALLASSCGSSGTSGEGTTDAKPPTAPPDSLEALWRRADESIAVVPGTSDHAPGRNRISFLIVDSQSRLVERPTATVWIATSLAAKPYAQMLARLEEIGIPGGAKADAQHIYVATVAIPRPGKYWFLARPLGGRDVRALGNLVVKKDAAAPDIGDRAVPSRTPTLASTNGDLERLSTSRRPDRALYAVSVREALRAGQPFVVTFATPLFCQTRTCGPVVDVVSAVRRQFAGRGVRFIHAEVYQGNDPAKGLTRWMREWRLPTEPWTFVVDRRGRIVARFEGAFSAQELARAVRRVVS